MENQVTVSDIRPPLQPAPELPPLGHDSGDLIPAEELLPGVKQLLDAPESSQYEDCKDSVEHHRHSGNRPVVPGHQNQDEVASDTKEATAHIRQTVPHAPFLADRNIRDRAVLADPGVSGTDAVAMGSVPSVADSQREVTGATRGTDDAPQDATPLESTGPHVAQGKWQVDAVKTSKGAWAFRLRWAEGRKRGTPIYVARVSDEMYTAIREADYEQFKAELISIHQSRAI